MAQRTFVFPNFVSDHDGIPHKWKFTLYLMHVVKFVDFHFSQWHRPWVSMPHPIFFDFLILSMQKVAWKLDFCWMMISASKKWWLKEALCFQMSCQITMASDARTQTSFVFKFCVGSHQDLTHKLSTASAFLNFVSDPINIRHKKKQSLLCCQILCRIPSTSDTKKQSRLCFQVLCRIPSTSDTKIKACCVAKFHVGSKFCVGSHQHPTQKKQSRWCFHVLNRIPSASDTKMKVTKL